MASRVQVTKVSKLKQLTDTQLRLKPNEEHSLNLGTNDAPDSEIVAIKFMNKKLSWNNTVKSQAISYREICTRCDLTHCTKTFECNECVCEV